ncbi:MAG: hypothetical protein IIX19_05465 [Alistipes sp.]|nr:hypothetical protein [Alistipes sp.]
MKKSIFLAIATLFLAVCTTSLGYANTVQQTNTTKPDDTKFTIGIIYHEKFSWYVSQIEELVKWTHWDVIVANQKEFKTQDGVSAEGISKILERSNIAIIATHGKYDEENGRHMLMFGDQYVTATAFNDERINVKKDAIIFAAACKTVSGDTLEEMNEFPLVFINKGASMYFGYNVSVDSLVAYDSFAYYLNALMEGKSIQKAKEDRPSKYYLTPDPGIEEIPLFIFPDNKDYRIPRWYFPGFIVGRELMIASIKKDDLALDSALEQFKADLEFIKSIDSKLGEAYIEDLKKGVKSVLVDEAVKKGGKIEEKDLNLEKEVNDLVTVFAMLAEHKR